MMRNNISVTMLSWSLVLTLWPQYSLFLFIFAFVLIGVRKYMLWTSINTHGLPLPPGPEGHWLYGYMKYLEKDYHLTMTELAKKFGSVYQIYLGWKRVIVINDYQMIREAFRQQVFSGRPDTALTKLLKGLGIINSVGALWQEQRLFLHSVLRDFGAKNMGPNKIPLEKNIQTQVDDFLSEMHSTKGQPSYIRPKLARVVSNVVGSMLMSVTFENQNTDFERLMKLIEEGFKLLTTGVPVNFIPFFKYIPYLNRGYEKIKKNKEETEAYFCKIAEQHKRTYVPGQVRDFVDAFYAQQQKWENENKETYFSDKQLLQVMGDVYSAGLETVTSTLEWTVLYLLRNQDVQQRLHEEIELVVGNDRKPSLNDMPHMPYTEATIWEVLRKANVIALGNAHATLDNTQFRGFFIPKGTHIIPNLWAVHMDPNLWDKPEEFNPQRFLVDNRVVKPPYFMPFSVGRRMCVGDTLTKMEVFLFLTSLLQEFELCIPEGEKPPSDKGVSNLSMTCQKFHVCLRPRKLV